jgi:CDP-glucose 4,6-dehydratase
MPNANFWEGKRIFLTGHTGFKGAWMTLWLERLGAVVSGFSLPPPTGPSLFAEANLSNAHREPFGDIRNYDDLSEALSKSRADIIIHMAAQPLVRDSYQDPLKTFTTNVQGTVNLLEAWRQSMSAKVCLIVTSDKCYENDGRSLGYTEGSPMGGYDPYSCSKGCAELVVSAYGRSFFDQAGLATVRAGNVIGGGDWSVDRLIPDIFRAWSSDEILTLRNPGAIRPWQHVLDCLNGYMLLTENLWNSPKAYYGGWNFGPSNYEAKDVLWVTSQLASGWGEDARWKTSTDGNAPHEAQTLTLDSTKAADMLGWRPALSLNEALEKTSAWYRKWRAGQSARELCIKQIEDYEDKLKSASTENDHDITK